MQATDRPEFTPPADSGLLRSVGLALLAHAVLVLGLSWGLKWKRDQQDVAVEAELWSATVQQAAPRAVEPTPAPPPPPPQVRPAPPPPPVQREADIALERERERQAREQARREEAERQKLAAQKRREEEAERQKVAAQKRREDEAERKAATARQAAEDRKKQEQARTRQEQQEAARLAKLREENLRRIAGLAGASGGPSSTGTAMQSSAPSASYGGRVIARVKPNIVFTDDVSGNPRAEVEVRLAPDGTIIGRRLTNSSGIRSWDEAVLRAIDRTERFPPDTDGRVPSSIVLGFRPKDL